MEAARRGITFNHGVAGAEDRRLDLRWDLAGVFRNAAILIAVEAAIVASLLVFRLGAQFMSWRPGLPWSFLYRLSGVFASPFQRFETAQPEGGATVIQYSVMLALETYLVAGLLLVLAFAGLALLTGRYVRRSWDWTIDAGPLYNSWRDLEASLSSFAEDVDRYGSRVTPARRSERGQTASAQERLTSPRRMPPDARQALPRRWHAPGSKA